MVPTDRTEGVLEVVLHNAGDEGVIDAFIEYARRHGASPIADRRRSVKGLTFVPVRTDFALAEQLARFRQSPLRTSPQSLGPNPSSWGIKRRVGSCGR